MCYNINTIIVSESLIRVFGSIYASLTLYIALYVNFTWFTILLQDFTYQIYDKEYFARI